MEETRHIHDGSAHQAHEGSASTSGEKSAISDMMKEMSAAFRGIDLRFLVIIFAIYFVIALFVFLPLTLGIGSLTPGSGGDTFVNLWSEWWVGYAILSAHTSFYYTNLFFYPLGASMAYQTLSPVVGLLSLPFQAVSVSFAYNAMFFIAMGLSGATMFILAEYIVKDKRAAFVAGLVFAFSSFHIAQAIGHIEWINIEWVPLAIYFFIRIIRNEGGLENAIGLGASFMLTVFMGDTEQGVELVLALFAIICAYLVFKNTRVKMLRPNVALYILVAIAIAFALGFWGFLPILKTIAQPGGLSEANYQNNVTYNNLWSDNVGSYLVPSYYNGIFDRNPSQYFTSVFSIDPSERIAYIGYLAMALAVYGIYITWKEHKMQQIMLWLGMAAVFGLITLGPSGLLYEAYHATPLGIIREPDRFFMIFSIAAAILVAFGVKELFHKLKIHDLGTKSLALLGIITLVFIIENNALTFTPALHSQVVSNATIPAFYYDLARNKTGNFSILPLPTLQNPESATPSLYPGLAAYYTSASHVPIVGGIGATTRTNLTQELLLYSIPLAIQSTYLEYTGIPSMNTYYSPVLENYTAQTLLFLFEYQAKYVVVEKSAYSSTALSILNQYLTSTFGNPVYNDNTTAAYSTLHAINNSIFRQFVADPILNSWEAVSLENNETAWLPINGGEVIVYAPYSNATSSDVYSLLSSDVSYPVKTRVSFQAASLEGSRGLLEIAEETSTGTAPLGEFNVSTESATYALNISLDSGPNGNLLLFIPGANGTAPIGIENITFSSR